MSALVLVSLLALSGCSGEDKSYSTPSSICGVSVDKDALKGLLPAGNKLTVKASANHEKPETRFCNVIVDGDIELSSEGAWRKAGYTAKDAAEDALAFNYRATGGGRYAVWDDGAATVFDCRNSAQDAARFSVEFHVVHPQGKIEGKVERFIGDYAEAYRKTVSCEE
ncbi:hypothetical protein CLM62_16785 [Streptomyces sp. SA15]|nr:hypothetical protein CLM62_16785 [Streptomyces sp. SA15]